MRAGSSCSAWRVFNQWSVDSVDSRHGILQNCGSNWSDFLNTFLAWPLVAASDLWPTSAWSHGCNEVEIHQLTEPLSRFTGSGFADTGCWKRTKKFNSNGIESRESRTPVWVLNALQGCTGYFMQLAQGLTRRSSARTSHLCPSIACNCLSGSWLEDFASTSAWISSGLWQFPKRHEKHNSASRAQWAVGHRTSPAPKQKRTDPRLTDCIQGQIRAYASLF